MSRSFAILHLGVREGARVSSLLTRLYRTWRLELAGANLTVRKSASHCVEIIEQCTQAR